MNDYASIKGRATAPAPEVPRRKPPSPLQPVEQAHVEANRKFILEHMPELAPLIRELYTEGLIDGWRAVRNCSTIKGEK